MQLMRFAWKTKIITKGGTTRFSPKQPGKKSDLLQNIIYPPKGKKKINKKEKYWNKQHLEVKVVWSTYPFYTTNSATKEV